MAKAPQTREQDVEVETQNFDIDTLSRTSTPDHQPPSVLGFGAPFDLVMGYGQSAVASSSMHEAMVGTSIAFLDEEGSEDTGLLDVQISISLWRETLTKADLLREYVEKGQRAGLPPDARIDTHYRRNIPFAGLNQLMINPFCFPAIGRMGRPQMGPILSNLTHIELRFKLDLLTAYVWWANMRELGRLAPTVEVLSLVFEEDSTMRERHVEHLTQIPPWPYLRRVELHLENNYRTGPGQQSWHFAMGDGNGFAALFVAFLIMRWITHFNEQGNASGMLLEFLESKNHRQSCVSTSRASMIF